MFDPILRKQLILQLNRHCPKQFWKTLNSLVKGRSSNIGLKKDNCDIYFDADFVANKFNNFISAILQKKLVEKLPTRTFNKTKITNLYKFFRH